MIELESWRLDWAATLDEAAVARLVDDCDGDGTVLRMLVTAFSDDAPALVAGLKRALRTGSAGDVRLAAHTLKSHGLTFGAPLLAHVARELEALAREGDLSAAARLVGELEREYERTREALAALASERAA
jgi:HPt (histidine-containing phosphotransfer) domain-containing protein